MNPLARKHEFDLHHGSNTVTLRASLRAALMVERLHDGFGPLLQKLDQLDTGTIRAVILAAATDRRAAEAMLSAAGGQPLGLFLAAATSPLSSLIAAFMPDTADTSTPTAPAAKPTTWAEHFQELYRIGTGWLCWAPAATLDATPAEITEAFAGHIAKLEAMHGGKPDDTDNEEQRAQNIALGLDPDFDRAGLHALRTAGA